MITYANLLAVVQKPTENSQNLNLIIIIVIIIVIILVVSTVVKNKK